VEAGNILNFNNLSLDINKNKNAYLFVTINIGPAVGRHIYIDETPFEHFSVTAAEYLTQCR